jgi:hypothetical protein
VVLERCRRVGHCAVSCGASRLRYPLLAWELVNAKLAFVDCPFTESARVA